MGRDSLTMKEVIAESDDAILITLRNGRIETHTSIEDLEQFRELLETVLEAAESQLFDKSVAITH
jgi:hypothetical protein